ncbi:MutS-related protein [Pedobacter hiemivivus]|uniref:DNA mismatch repair protein n=1 Tax=Pedobacter hiemivivus TaxID=2530454 RepID=A0A4R0NJM2_9SPHI|nr:DNA mismatch repair protein [Pedobacter hiemivivus]TCC99503.1 DNA mismatch repair protein [Pedobacter hiemivivus]
MSLATDKQTLKDFSIFENKGKDSVYQLFNHTSTGKGAELLEQMFRQPLSDRQQINERIGIFKFFESEKASFPFQGNLFELVEAYLDNTDTRTLYSAQDNTIVRRLQDLLGGHDHAYRVLYGGVISFINILQVLRDFIAGISVAAAGSSYARESKLIEELLAEADFQPFLMERKKGRLSFLKVIAHDKKLRFLNRDKIRKLLHYIYKIDVYIAVAKAANENHFNFPEALDKDSLTVKLKGFAHPLLSNAIPYDLEINPDSNIIFLTGANMAGKSTFMKALGITMYLAHMGFPVSAASMQFSVMDGIYSTINLPDNLSMGYSHFYAEVLRIKKMAHELSTGKNLFIIFDELFRGTNVKDAYEATIALTEAFSEKRNCKFVISTHIVEAGEVLKERRENINFLFLPTKMEGSKPVYTYKLEPGITEDRHGMLIINNEGILELLEKRENGILKHMES